MADQTDPTTPLRVHELAKELGTDSKTLIAWLTAAGRAAKSAQSRVEPQDVELARTAFAAAPADAAAPAAPVAAEAAADPAGSADPVGTAAPTARTRRRAAVSVPFQPPAVPAAEESPAPVAAAAAAPFATPAAVDTAAEGDETAGEGAPRRRRRAGTAGAIAPATFLAPQDALDEPAARTRRSRVAGGDAELDADQSDLADPALEEDPDGGVELDEDGNPRPRSRRRRGRRGRGRRPEDGEAFGEAGEAGDVASPGGGVAGEDGQADEGEQGEDDDEDGTALGGTRRRRRRRRGGSGLGSDDDAPTASTAREPRERQQRVRGASEADEDGVRGISGSTRMAAKRARRQEGRDSGRRRPPVLTEAEFLARREAVERVMVVRQKGERTQIAVLEDGVLVEHYVTKASAQSFAGNIYLGKVQNVLPSMEAAFVDIGKGRNAVLYAGEVNYELLGVGPNQPRKIEAVLKPGQEVLVQVTKDPIGHKGARLTSQISLPGRHLVYLPEGSMTGISRKLPEVERARLKSVLKRVLPDNAGVIVRTAAEGVGEEEIERDVRRLQAQWDVVAEKAAKGGGPVLLHAEPDLVIKVVRDVFNEDFTRLVVQGDSEWETIRDYVEFVAPDLAPRLSRYAGDGDVFREHRIDEQLAKALDRKVWLPSGGSLVIDRTEAMVVIDVNTGKYVGKGGNLEETVTRNNLEAAEEIARQLRLRDLGGIVVVDFIDMVLESNRDLVVRRLVECMGRDRTKHQVAEVSSLGLVQMTRKRVGQGLLESFSESCDHCNGRGVLVRSEPVDAKPDRGERAEGGRGDGGRGDGGREPRGEGEGRSRNRKGKGGTGNGNGNGGGSGNASVPIVSVEPESPEEAERRRSQRERGPKPGSPVRTAEERAAEAATDAARETAADVATDAATEAAGETVLVTEARPRRRRAGREAGAQPSAPVPPMEPVVMAAPVVTLVSAGTPAEAGAPATSGTSGAPGASGEAGAPPRRRRATSRPAGPPTAG